MVGLTYGQTRRVSMSLREMHFLMPRLRVYDVYYPPFLSFISVNDIIISCLAVAVLVFRWGALRVPYSEGHSIPAKRAQRTRRHAAVASLGEGNHQRLPNYTGGR